MSHESRNDDYTGLHVTVIVIITILSVFLAYKAPQFFPGSLKDNILGVGACLEFGLLALYGFCWLVIKPMFRKS